MDEDPARAELDRRLVVDVLQMPGWLCEPGGPVDLLRRKLAREPQIHGGKKSRVVFSGNTVLEEKQVKRPDVTVQSWWVELAEGGLPNAGAGGSGYVIYLGWMRKSTSALRTGMC